MSGPAMLGTREARPQLLEVQDLHVSYGAITALRGVSLAVGQGEVVALIGANGAGKTSTLRAVCGMLKPRSGRIRLAAQEIQGLKSNLLVPQGHGARAGGAGHLPEPDGDGEPRAGRLPAPRHGRDQAGPRVRASGCSPGSTSG